MANSAPGTQLVHADQALSTRRRGHYGPFARWLLHKLFDPVPFPADAVAPLQKLSEEATLVYVLRSSSLLHLLFFNWTFSRLALPLARAATGLGSRIFAPFARWYLGGRQVRARQGGEVANVVEAVRRGEAAMVFLRAPRTLPSAVTGPPLKSADRVVEETLRDLQLRRALAEIARERGRADGSVEKEARKDLREIAARYNPLVVDLLKRLLDFVFHRIYDGVDVDEAGMKRLVEASKRGPLILCPCHKSHIDYMILSMICDDYGLQPPHVAAGDNLNFWPVGRLLRAGGAFFIRRTFRGDRIYSATLGAYVKRLLQDGFTQEFFIEGGRSRTGKLLSPKFGMLTLEVDAWLTGVKPDAYFAPVSLSYERIVEARSYQHELLGGEKQKESAKALLSATKVLRSRLGRITIRVDEPISLARLLAERGVDPKNHTNDERRALVRALVLRVAAGINRAA